MNTLILCAALATVGLDYSAGRDDLPAGTVIVDYAAGRDMPTAPASPPQNPAPAPRVAKSPAPAAGHYPVRGGNWTYPGNSRAELLRHLTTDGMHAGRFNRAWLESLSYQELLSLHSDHHEGRVQRAASQQASSSAARAKAKAEGLEIYGTRDGKPPVPLGSAIRGFFGDPQYSVRQYSSRCPNGRCPR